MLSALVLLAMASAQDARLDAKASIEIPAAPAERLVPALGKAWGVELRAVGATKKDVLVVSVKNVALRALMDRIARLDTAEWVQAQDGAYELTRTSERAKKQEVADRKELTRRFAEAQKALSKRLPPFAGMTTDEAAKILRQLDERRKAYDAGANTRSDEWISAGEKLYGQLPDNRLAQRILLGLDPAVFASIPERDQFVFSDKPNAAQFKLPMDLTGAYREFLKEWSAFTGASGLITEPDGTVRAADDALGWGVFREAPRRCLCKLTRYGVGIYLQLLLDDGKWLRTSHSSPPHLYDARTGLNAKRDSARLLDSVDADAKLWLTELAKEFGREQANGQIARDTHPELLKRLLDPVTYEPLAALPGAVALAAAQERKVNLVGVLTDEIRAFETMAYHPELTVAQAEGFFQVARMTLTVESGWMEVAPDFPSDVWPNRLDRSTLKSWMAFVDKGAPNLTAMARFAAEFPRVFENTRVFTPVFFLPSGQRLVGDMNSQYHGYRLISALGGRAALKPGRVFRVGDLTTVQRAALWNAVYLGQTRFERVGELTTEQIGKRQGFGFGEATEILTEGLLPDATVTVEASEDYAVVACLNGQPLEPTPWDPRTLAIRLKGSSMPNAPERPKPTHFRSIWRKHFVLRFRFAPDLAGTLDFVEEEKDPTGRLLTFQELPAAFRDEVNRIVASRTTGGGISGGSGSGAVKP